MECVTFDSAEENVVAGSSSGTLKLWDLEEAKGPFAYASDSIHGEIFSKIFSTSVFITPPNLKAKRNCAISLGREGPGNCFTISGLLSVCMRAPLQDGTGSVNYVRQIHAVIRRITPYMTYTYKYVK